MPSQQHQVPQITGAYENTCITPSGAQALPSRLTGATIKGPIRGWLIDITKMQICLVIYQEKAEVIGRHPACDMILSELSVSNRHCRFSADEVGQVLCKDLSTNGTFWNNNLIGRGESIALSNGDSIWIRRNHRFVFQNSIKTPFDHHDPQIKSLQSSYQILPRTLGRGTFAQVNVAIHRKSWLTLAVKIMDRIRFRIPQNSGGTNIEKEIAILRSIDHANIIAVVDVIKTPRYMYIFMQMLPGGDLFDYIVKNGPLSELEAKFAIYQVLQALQHLHQLNISHRDLKPENLLLASAKKYARLVLTDFGMARQFDKKYCMNTMCGTYAYMAPEVLEVQFIESPGYSCAADCWSLGITLYMILTGAHPFTSHHASEDEEGMRQALYTRDVQFPRRHWKRHSLEACTLIRNLLAFDPDERWTVDQALSSDWIQKDIRWLRHKYRECVLPHWAASSRQLGIVRQDASLRYEALSVRHCRLDGRSEHCNPSPAHGVPHSCSGSRRSSTTAVPDVCYGRV